MDTERSDRDQDLRALWLVCVVAVLAAVFGWVMHELVNGISQVGERDRARLARDLAAARREIETQTAALKKAPDKTAETQQLAEVQQALKQERDKGEGLARDLAAARREIETQAAALKKATDKTAETQQLAEVQQALKQEHDKGEGLARDLAAARREIETQAAALKKATDKTAETQQLAEVQQALKQERGKGEGLARDLAAARREIETQTAALKKATDKTAETQQLAEVQQALKQERGKGEGLARDLAAARREIETQAAALKKATDKTAETQQLAEVQQALQQSEARREALAKELRSQTAAPLPKSEPVIDKPVAARQSPTAAPPSTEERFMARARQLVEQGNISAARSMLERAAEGGSARALFALAETYDSNMLSAWGTVGIQGDTAKAKELYGKALAGGVEEANARLKALQP